MTLAPCLMFLLLSSVSGVCSQTLTESEPVVKQPGQSHKLTCTYAGISDNDAYMNWVRQAEGKEPEWIASISPDSTKVYAMSAQNHFTISRDNNVDQVYLQMNRLTTTDSAVYYCARTWVGGYAFEYWGKGTKVTVTSGTPVPPALFPLVQCAPQTQDKVTVGCLARDFTPDSLTFQWTSASGSSMTSVQYPPVMKESKYTAVSLVEVTKSDWDSRKSFQCSVTHGSQNKQVQVQKLIPPKVTLLSVPNEDAQTLVCTIEDSSTDPQVSFKWKKNSAAVNEAIQTTMTKTGELHSAASILKVTNTEWDSKAVYTCEVTYQGTTYTKKASKAHITVTLKQPSPKEIFNNNQAKLDCVITGQDGDIVSGVKISWQIDGQDVSDNITESAVTSGGGQHSKTSTMTRSRSEWQRVNKVRCFATRDEATPVIQDLTVNKGDGSDPKVTVHILPDKDVGKEKSAEVTLVCLVSSPVLQDYYIAWSEEEGQNTKVYSDGINFPPQKSQNGYSVTSVYSTTKAKWDNDTVFNCNVWPAGSSVSMKPQGVSNVHGNSLECDK